MTVTDTARRQSVRRYDQEGLTMAYIIKLTNGTTIPAQHSARAPFATYEEAVAACEREWPEAEIGHDGDLTGGGDRTLVWACEADSVDDDGAYAVASIVKTDAE